MNNRPVGLSLFIKYKIEIIKKYSSKCNSEFIFDDSTFYVKVTAK